MTDCAAANARFPRTDDPIAIIRHALAIAGERPMVSTNFRPGEAVLLHLVVQVVPDIPVLWVDHGYNTPDTYRCADRIINRLRLNIHLEAPRVTAAHREAVRGGIPSLDQAEEHARFTEEVKLEPFRRGLAALRPTVWFTALRRGQTALRDTLCVFNQESPTLIKVCPILDWTDADMSAYLTRHDLPDETVYFDPTKVDGKRECGLHTRLHQRVGVP